MDPIDDRPFGGTLSRPPRPAALILLLSACAVPTAPSATPSADTGWWARVQPRLDAENEAFFLDGEGYVARLQGQGLRARFDASGVRFDGAITPVVVTTTRWGRADALVDATPVAPALGGCGPTPDAGGDCIPRLEYAEAGLLTWWHATLGGFEQGWDLDRSPNGQGPIRIELGTDATVEAAEDGIWLVGADGAGVHVGEVAAWDAAGVALEARLVALADGFAVEVDDTGAIWPITIDPIYTTAATTITGSGSNYGLGYSVDGAGDVNKDGYDDLVVGAPGYSSDTGRVYVFHGNSSGVSTSASTTIDGPSSDAGFGISVAGAGDTDGDNYADIIVGAPGYNSNRGLAYIYYGTSSGITTSGSDTISTSSENLLGWSVDGAGDVDNDGYDDVIVGQPYYNSYAGRARVYYGGSGGVDTGSPDTLTVSGAYGVGYSVSGAGDVNHDGYADVVVGAPWYGFPAYYGAAYVFHGGSSGIGTSAATSITGSSSNAQMGTAVGGGGDVNGDNYDDIVVGAPSYSSTYGRVTVHHGSSSGVSSTAATTLTATTGEGLGSFVAVIGDTDLDGYDEIAIGAPNYSSYTGHAYVYAGSATGIGSTASVTLTGSSSPSYFGVAVAGAGDVNNDGYADLAVGAYGYDSYKGRAYVYLGYSPDTDGDGWADAVDCDDTNAAINPGATEVCDASNTDEDCDGLADDSDTTATGKSTWYKDTDSDTYGGSTTRSACDQPSGYVSTSTDCNDASASINPGATEICDASNTDEDCDGQADNNDSSASSATKTNYYRDGDADGYGGSTTAAYCDLPSGYTATSTDCNDSNSAINPGATEVCDTANTDEDCDGLTDDSDPTASTATKTVTRYTDADGDSYGSGTAIVFCDAPTGGYATTNGDCNDASSAINPGATEVCDAADTDEDCDAAADDYDSSATGKIDYYRDSDSDGYGAGVSTPSCNPPSGWVSVAGDCNDTSSAINPAASEVCDAGNTDEDCDGAADDADAGATGKSTWYQDGDTDGYGGDISASYCDGSLGWVANSDDCNDAAGTISPAASEVCDASDTDEDCDGLSDDADPGALAGGKSAFYQDADADGYGGLTVSYACDLAAGYATTNTDCNDAVATVNPAAAEVCDSGNTDEDCDGLAEDGDPSATGQSAFYRDLDGDTFGAGTGVSYCDAPSGYSAANTDCNDGAASINPAAVEICDPSDTDEDCDGVVDDDDTSAADATKLTVYTDADGDSYGSSSSTLRCDVDAGYATVGSDCDDTDGAIHPGATEVCDAGDADEDCDGAVDDLDSSTSTASKATWYRDGDGDGYAGTSTTRACEQPVGYGATTDDCDDADVDIHPGAAEVVADGIDQDCDGAESCYADGDGDGYRTESLVDSSNASCADAGESLSTAPSGDCDDADAAYNPGAIESDCADPNDYNCDGSVGFSDNDADGYAACEECDDANAAIHPGGQELCDDANVDEDCDGLIDDADGDVAEDGKLTVYADADADGYGGETTATMCDLADGYTETAEDCDDSQAGVNPGAVEVCDATDTDEDCDGLVNDADPDVDPASQMDYFLDGDGDGYGGPETTHGCSRPEGYAATSDDCDDAVATINPGATEVCDALDNDCDLLIDDEDDSVDLASAGTWYADTDADGYGDAASTLVACAQPDGWIGDATDCDDADAEIHPGGAELPGDTIDGDCDTYELCYRDADEDGWRTEETVLSADTACLDGGIADMDVPAGDCDDTNPDYHPSAPEDCDLPYDYNCDGSVGYLDGDADGWAACEECDDGDAGINPDATEVCNALDDNCDGSVDGADAEGATTWYADGDEDGYASEDDTVTACDAPIGYGPATSSSDCDDADGAIHPAADEGVDDGIDQDCDGLEVCLADNDGDGYRPDDETTTLSDDMQCDGDGEGSWADPTDDCDDEDPSVYPGAEEVPYDGIDQDCDGVDLEDGFPDDTGEKPERVGGLYGGGGCGCASDGSAGVGAGAMIALLGLIRRRRPPDGGL